MKKTVEQKAADVLLGRSKTIRIGGKYIKQPPITGSTFIAASSVLSEIPVFTKQLEATSARVLNFALFKSKEYKAVFEAISILAVGCPLEDSDSWLKRRKRRKLAHYIANHVPARELTDILSQLLEGQDTRLFFDFMTSLSELNLLAAKSETIYGEQS